MEGEGKEGKGRGGEGKGHEPPHYLEEVYAYGAPLPPNLGYATVHCRVESFWFQVVDFKSFGYCWIG